MNIHIEKKTYYKSLDTQRKISLDDCIQSNLFLFLSLSDDVIVDRRII